MAEIAFTIVGKIGEYLVAPIGRQFGYLFSYNNNIDNLRDQAKKLKDIKDGVQLSVSAAKNNLEVIAPRVESWLTDVEEIMTKSDRVFEDKASVDQGCLNGWCSNPKTRYLLSREASKQAKVILELRSEGEHFSKVSYPAPPTGTAESSSTGGFKGLQFHAGKTTMVEEIAKRAKSEKKIDEFAMAVVSQNIDVIHSKSTCRDVGFGT
ncbi:hypothetical protein LguiB_005451 [Lonicera macranthoides]